ncbi:MAG TPA: biotin/lipoyl-containing protein, partial [Nocardioidaceae bacterium]|nr:biotin/lipoyl-containing protein [Nocardioidaceae bacterium]
LPLLVKASAGGGGRGMRVVRRLDDLPAHVDLAAGEAAAAFGDATVFCEPYVEHGRHVEVQVLGDTHGAVVVLGDRDCSIQRRHQKVVEEAPAPGLRDETRRALHEAARAAAAAIDYVGAGTVEFLLDPRTERFWFLEMNTRLQVEHPVTECVFGIDLVAQQLHVAEGRALGGLVATGSAGRAQGHAVEVRLYAEDPAHDWQPQSGRLLRLDVPGASSAFAAPAAYGIRVDSGYDAGTEVGTHYDAMLAKVVAWAPTREQALRRLAATLAGARIHGVRTNRDLLVEVLRHPAFLAGEVSTDFFDRHDLAQLAAPLADARRARLSAFAAAVALAERDRAGRAVQSGIPAGWRNVVSQPQGTRFATDEEEVAVGWYGGRDGYRPADLDGVRVLEATARRVLLTDGSPGVVRAFEVYAAADRVDVESSLGHVALRLLPRFADPADRVASGSLLAPMPGTVVGVAVSEGQQVRAGEPVLVLEAMKMQHTVSAPHAGVVAAVSVAAGQQVQAGAVLAVVEEE